MRARIVRGAAVLLLAGAGLGCGQGSPGSPARSDPAPLPSPAPEKKVESILEAARAIRLPPIPELPSDQLPPRTAPPPDPDRDQYRRDAVYVRIDERIQTKDGTSLTSEASIVGKHLIAYFRRAGFDVVPAPEGAAYRIEGSCEGRFESTLELEGRTIAHEYAGRLVLTVKGAGGETELERIEIEDLRQQAPEEVRAALDLRRQLAKIAWSRLYQAGSVFTDPEIPGLIASLAADDPENEAPIQGDEVLKKIVARRLAAIPYLLEALTDEREVLVNATYPGRTALNAGKLHIYHLADKALEEIFQKVSRMNLETTAEKRFVILRGWENEWRRFCPSFREVKTSR